MNWHEIGLSRDKNVFGGKIKVKAPMEKTQIECVAELISRPKGTTSFQIIIGAGTVSPHARLAELKAQGWNIFKVKVEGKKHHTYFGTKP